MLSFNWRIRECILRVVRNQSTLAARSIVHTSICSNPIMSPPYET